MGGGFGNHFFVLKTSRNATKHMILPFKLKGDVISDHFLMLGFQKDSLDDNLVGQLTWKLVQNVENDISELSPFNMNCIKSSLSSQLMINNVKDTFILPRIKKKIAFEIVLLRC